MYFVKQNRLYTIFAKQKSDQILRIYFKIFRGIDHYNLSGINVHNDIMSRKMCTVIINVFSQTKQIISDFGKSRV